MEKFLKTIIYFTLNLFYKKNGAIILMYHAISDDGRFFSVSTEDFRKQMKYLFDNKYNVISLEEMVENLSRKTMPKKTIVLTFDDGYQNSFLTAFPILKKYDFQASIFLTTRSIGKVKEGGVIGMLDWEEVKKMDGSGLIDFEPHTVTHPKLTSLKTKEIENEIIESKEKIEKELQKKCKYFAYPKGKYNAGIKEAVKDAGFKAAFTVEKGVITLESDFFSLKRNSVDSQVNLTQFKGIVRYGRI